MLLVISNIFRDIIFIDSAIVDWCEKWSCEKKQLQHSVTKLQADVPVFAGNDTESISM